MRPKEGNGKDKRSGRGERRGTQRKTKAPDATTPIFFIKDTKWAQVNVQTFLSTDVACFVRNSEFERAQGY